MAFTYDPDSKSYSDGNVTLALNNDGVYEIYSVEQLMLFRDAVNAGNNFNGQTVRLMESIDLNDKEWTPIGTSSATAFQGTFDGNGQTISNLKITKDLVNTAANNNVGFFGYTKSPAKITDLTINNVDITGSLYVGAIVGYGFTGAEISNCRVTGQIEIEGWWYIGGIGGNGYVSKVDNCTVEGDDGSYIKGIDGSYVGGIWGYRGEGNMTISDCSVDNIDISGNDRVGGISGIAHYGNTIEGCAIENSSITAANNAGNIGLIAGANLGQLITDKGDPAGPAILLNNTADVETKESFTVKGELVSDPPMLGENDNNGNPGKAAIIGDVEMNEAGEITGGAITVVGTEQAAVDVNSKLDFAEGFQAYPTGDGTLEVDETGYVASVNGVRYKTLNEALTASGAGDTITLLDNVTLSSKLSLSQNQVFELSKFTLTGNIEIQGNADVKFQNGTMTATSGSSVISTAGESVLRLDGVTVDGGEVLNQRSSIDAITYVSTGGLYISNSEIIGGTLTHNDSCGNTGTNSAGKAINAYAASGGTISIENSTVTGGYGKTDATFTGYQSQLFVEGEVALQLGGTAEVMIFGSTITGGGSNWSNADVAINVSNSFYGTLAISDSSKIYGGDALNESGGNWGIGGTAIYTHQDTGCMQITVTDSEIVGGAGFGSWDGSGIEVNKDVPMTIENSTLVVGQGTGGNAGSIAISNRVDKVSINLTDVVMNGAGDGNAVIKNATDGLSISGEITISGGTLEDVEFVEVAEGTTIKTTGTGTVDPTTVTNPTQAPVYDETAGGYVFEALETSTDTLFVDDDWASLAEGTVVQVDGKNYRVGLNAFGSIQAAVDAAADGATVNVAAGSYAEDVTISKGITINGAEGHVSAVRSFGIGADNVTIDGFAIAPTNQNCYGSGEMPLAAGVYLTAGGAGAPLQNISVVNNTIDCSGVMADGVKATGVAFGTGSSSHFSTNVKVMNNTITGGGSSTAQNGLYLRFVDGAVVSGNTINGFSHHLAQFESGGNYTVAENVLSNTDRNGLQFGGVTTGTNVVSGNDISDCRGESKDDGALVLRNDGDEGTMSVTGNTITGNYTGVYISEVTNVGNLTITGNVIDQNNTDIVSNSDSNIMLAGNNYGPDGALTKTYGNGALNVGESTDPVSGVALILVNAEYAGHNTVLGPDGNFYKVGENAFANMKDAAPAITADTLEVRVTGKVSWPGNQTVDMSAASGKNTITFNDITDGSNIGAYRTYIKGNGSTVVVFNNVNGSCNIFLSDLEEVSIVGNSTVDLTAYNNFDSKSSKSFTNVGKLTVMEGSTCHFANANQFGLGDTVISGAGTIKSSGTLIVSGDNSQFTGVLEIANGVVMESVQSGFANASQIINNGTMQCNAAGTFTYDQAIVGNGMIKAWVQNAGTEVVITGDISGYTGQFDVVSGNTIKLNTTLNDTVNLAHSGGAAGTVELNGDGTAKDITINSTTTTTTGLKVFANWNNVTVQSNGNETSTVLGTIYFGGNGNAAAAEDFDMTLSAINATGGKSLGNLYFGGISNTVIDSADANANAISVVVDTIYGSLVGGGQQSMITGDITFEVVTGASGAEIVGAGEGNTVNGNIFINVNSTDDASVGNITGGRAVHKVADDISIVVEDGVVADVYGLNNGDANGTSVGNIQIDVTGGTVSSIRGGNSSAGKVPGVFEAESVKINLTGGEVTGKIYGGSQLSSGSIAIVVDGGEAADIYAGSKYAAVGTASIEVKDGSVGSIYGGGAGGTDDIGYSTVETSAIRISGGVVSGNIYGGGTEGDVTTSATVTITGGEILGGVYGADVTGTISGESTLSFENVGDYTTSITVISGFDDVSFNGGTVNFTGVTFENSVISVSDAAAELYTPYTFAATGAMSFGEGTQFRFGDELYTLGVAGENGFVFDYDAETGLVADLANLDTTKFVVNSSWSLLADRTVVEYDGGSYTIGTNAFGTFADAIAVFGSNATANQDTAEIIFATDSESGVSGTRYYLYTDTDLALTTDGTARTVTINGERFYLMNVYKLDSEFKPIPNDYLPTVTIGEGLTLITEGQLNVGQNVDVEDVEDGQPTRDPAAMRLVVDGTVITRLYVASNSEVVVNKTGRILMGTREAFITRTGAKMTVNGDGSKDEVQFEVNYTSMQGGTLTLNDTWMKSGVVWLSTSDHGYDNQPSALILNNSKLESSQGGIVYADSAISASSGSEMIFAGVVENVGTISLDASSFSAKGLTNTGTFEITNASVTLESAENPGTFNVSGNSTLNIGTLKNLATQDDPQFGAVVLLDGAVLTDSNVGGIVATEGDVTIAGTTTLGQLALKGSRGDDRTIVIDKDANVSLGHLDVGTGLQRPDIVPGDIADRVYYGHVLVEGALSVDKANQSGAIYIRPYAELVVTGTLDVKGEVHNRGSLVVDGGTMTMTDWETPKLLGYTTGDSLTITNEGTMTVVDADAVTFGEASASLQHMEVEAQYADGMFATISEGGKFEADTLAFANDDDVTLRVTGAGSSFKLYSADGREATSSYNYAQNEGAIIVEDQAVFDVSGLANDDFVNSGSFALAGGSATFATLTNTSDGEIVMDSASLLTVQSGLNNLGTITIDMSGAGEFGVYKLIDYTGTGSISGYGDVAVNNNYATVVIDNDLYAANVDMTTLKVNAAWSGLNIGDKVADGYFYGFNAFDTFEDAYNAGTSAVTILIGSDLTGVAGELGLDAPYRSDIRISSDDGNAYTLTFSSPSDDGLYAWNPGQKITIDKEITLTNMVQLMSVNADTLVTIDGNVTSMQLWAGFGGTININETATVTLTYGDGWLTLRGGGTLNVNGTVEDALSLDISTAQAQFDLGYSSIGDASSSNNYANSTNVFNLTNTFVDGGSWLNLGAATWNSGRNSVNMTNSVFKVNALNMYDDGKFNVDAGSRVIVNGALKVAEESVMTITDNSSVTAKTGTVSGTVNVDNGTLSIGSAVENSGTVNFSDAVDANTIVNTGVVNFKGGTEFQGEISGSGNVQYMGEGNKLTGDVEAQKFIIGLEGDDAIATSLEISGGATVNVTGGGNSGRIGVNTDVVITGDGTTFTDKANLTMDESATLEISDGAEVNLGYIATGGKTDVTGATLNLTGGTGTAGASAIGGLNDETEFNVNAGGVVNALNGLVIGHRETKDGLVNVNEGGELNVSGGALKVSGLVGNYTVQGNGTLNVNGGTVTASDEGDNGLIVGDAWDGASGIVNVTNGGSIEAYYSIQLNSTSKVTIDGGSMSAQQMYQSEGGELSIVNGGSVTLANSYFAMGGKITVGGDDSDNISRLETEAGAEARPASLGGDYTGHDGATVLNIEKKGEVILGTGLIVGHRAEENVSKDATVNVNEGGKLQVADSLQLGSTGEYQAQGVVNVNGGELDASAADVTINKRGELNVNGGSFSAQSVTNNGAVVITGTSTVDTKFAAAGTGSVEIVDATLGAGTSINKVDKAEAQTYYNNIALKGTVTITDGAYLNSGWNGNLAMGFGTGISSGMLNIAKGAVVSVGGSFYFGTEEADGNFQLNISGEGTSLQSNGNNGEFYIFGDAAVYVTDGASMTNNARIRSGATYVFGAVDDTVAASVQFRSFELVEGANVTIQGGATADLGILVFGDGDMYYNGSFTLAAGSLLKLSSYSSERDAAEITVSGIDDTFSGVRMLIDNTGSNTLDYSGMIANWGEINTSVKVVENDLYQANVDMTTLLVDSSWSGLSVATEVKDGYYYGFNAFDNMSEAIAVSADGTTISVASGTYAEDVVVTGNRALELGDLKMTSLMLGTKEEAFTGAFELGSLQSVGGSSSISDGALILRNGQFTMTDFTADVIALGNNNFDTSDEDAVVGTTYRISSGEVVVNNVFYVGCADAEKTGRRNTYTLTVDGDGQLKNEHGTLNIRQDGVFNVNGAGTDVNLSQFLVYGEANITDGAEVSAFNLQVYNDDDLAQLRVTDSTIKMQIDNLGGTVYVGDSRGSRSGSVSLENSTLEANILLLGSKTVGAGKSSLSLTGGSKLSVDKTFSITAGGVLTIAGASSVTANKDITNAGTITQDATSTLKVSGDFVNTGDATFDGTTTIVGNYDSDTLTLNAGAVFSAGSITVDALTMALGSSLELTGTGSVIDSFTVTGDTVVDMEYQLVVSGWDISYAGGKVFYQGDSYTVTVDTGSLNGINFVLGDDGNLYVKNFGATPEQVFIGKFDSTWSGEVGSRTKVIDGVTYVEGYTAFESMADAIARYPEIGTTVTSVILVNENIVDGFLYDDTNKVEMITVSALTGADEQNPTVSTIADGVTINGDLKLVIDEAAALTGGSINVAGGTTVENHGHLATTLVSGGALSLTNTSDYTLSGEYTAPSIELNNSGMAVDLTLNATTGDITIDNSGTMTDTVLNAFNAVVLSGEGEYEDVKVNSELLYLNGIDFTFTDGEVTTVYLNDQWMSIPGGKLTLRGGTVGKVDGLFGTTMSSGTVVIDGVDLAAITLSYIGRLQLASGESRFGGSEVATYSVEELEISAGASLNWSWTSDDANRYNIDIQSWSDDNRIKVVDADGTFAFTQVGEYAMENFDVSGFAGLVNVSGNSILNLEDEAGYFADGAAVTLESGAKLNLNGYGTDEVETGMNFLGDGEVAVNFDHSLTGDLSGFNGFYTLGSGVTATFEEVATLAGEMTLHGEGTANFANRTEPAAVRITSDELATNLVLNNNDATLVAGNFGTITTVANDGSISIVAGININADAVDVNAVNISIDSAFDYAGPALTVSGLANNFGTITVTSDTAEFKSPYTLIATDDGIGFGSEIAFTVGTDSVALTIGGAAVLFNNFWIQAYVEDGDLKIANVPGDSGEILVNSDWPATSGAQVEWLGVEHIIDRDASQTVDRALEIVAPMSTGDASTITIVKADTYNISNVAMTQENGVSQLVIRADSLDVDNPLLPGDVFLRGDVIATDGTAAGTELTLRNVSVIGNIFGGAADAALSGDAALIVDSSFGNTFTGMLFGGSWITSGSVDDSGISTSLQIDGGAYAGAYIAGGYYAQDSAVTLDSSTLTVTNTAADKLLINGRLTGGGVAKGAGASITQESASITIDSSDANADMLYLRSDIYAGGIQLSGGTVNVENTTVTFTGLGEKLFFTSRVSGSVFGQTVGTFAGDSTLVFDDFTGEFQGLIQDFATMKFTGDSVVTFSRKQTLSSAMNLEFSIEGRTNTSEAMFTVNEYGWVYGDTITITTGDFTTGTYVLADGYDFSSLNFVINNEFIGLDSAYTDAAGNIYTITASDNKLVLDYVSNPNFTIDDATGEQDIAGRTSVTVTGTNSDISFTNTEALEALTVDEDASLDLATTAIEANNLQVFSKGTIDGGIRSTGSDDDKVTLIGGATVTGNVDLGSGSNDLFAMDVDSLLDGALSNAEIIDITGFEDLVGTSGTVALIADAQSITNGFQIDGVDVELGSAHQVSDELWAQLSKDDDGSLMVSWGDTIDSVASALGAFKNETLAFGSALISSDGSSFSSLSHDDFSKKKGEGTLA